jgi:hypothetical protein
MAEHIIQPHPLVPNFEPTELSVLSYINAYAQFWRQQLLTQVGTIIFVGCIGGKPECGPHFHHT